MVVFVQVMVAPDITYTIDPAGRVKVSPDELALLNVSDPPLMIRRYTRVPELVPTVKLLSVGKLTVTACRITIESPFVGAEPLDQPVVLDSVQVRLELV